MSKRPRPTSHARKALVVSCIIERGRDNVLIATSDSKGAESRLWEFVSGWRRGNETPEAAMRRIAAERTGIEIDIHTGQPPFADEYEGRAAEFRFFLAGVVASEPSAIGYEEVRWVRRGRLCEYDFIGAHTSVVEWYAE
jgi:8-oxo-dGTP pyrophosphatase MutT (NUDIX family)